MRHATPTNPRGVMYGNLAGFPLSEPGRAQAAEAGRWLSQHRLDYVISSPRGRTRETAEIVAELNPGRPPIITDERLRDIDLIPQLEGKITFAEWDNRRQQYWQMREKGAEGFEPPVVTQARMVQVFQDTLADYLDTNIIFVSHAGPMAFLFQALRQQPLVSSKELTDLDHIGKSDIFEIVLTPAVIIKKVFEPTIK